MAWRVSADNAYGSVYALPDQDKVGKSWVIEEELLLQWQRIAIVEKLLCENMQVNVRVLEASPCYIVI